MKKLLQKLETASKTVIAIVTAGTTILGVLLAIYHGIYKLNQTASNLVKSLPVIENNTRFTAISIEYDIYLAEKQLSEKGYIDRILMRKLLLYKEDLNLTSSQVTSIKYLESKTGY